jgi:hypothetical protein
VAGARFAAAGSSPWPACASVALSFAGFWVWLLLPWHPLARRTVANPRMDKLPYHEKWLMIISSFVTFKMPSLAYRFAHCTQSLQMEERRREAGVWDLSASM